MINAVVWPLPRYAPVFATVTKAVLYLFWCKTIDTNSPKNEKHNQFAFDLTYFPTFRTESKAIVVPPSWCIHSRTIRPQSSPTVWFALVDEVGKCALNWQPNFKNTNSRPGTPGKCWWLQRQLTASVVACKQAEWVTRNALAREIPHTTPPQPEPYCSTG